MTRGKVLLIGLIVLLLGGVGYVGFDALGLKGFSAGIAAQSLLVLIVVVWTGSYLFRVVSGQMTYMEQRRRYREVYDEQEAEDLQKRFDALPAEEQQALPRESLSLRSGLRAVRTHQLTAAQHWFITFRELSQRCVLVFPLARRTP